MGTLDRVSPHAEELLAFFTVGGLVVGYFLGRVRAEIGRARHDGRGAMRNRANYRRRR